MITQNGCYTLTMDEYHGQPTDGPSVSASGLNIILNQCPAIFFETWSGNPNRVPEKTSAALDIGRAAHALVLGEPEFAKHFVISPYDDFRTKEARAWRDSETRTVLKADIFENIQTMADAQRRAPQVARAFVDGKPEQSLIWRDAETGVWVKSRPDWLPDDPASRPVIDYKTCRSLHPRKIGADVFEYGYHVQGAIIIEGIRVVMGVEPHSLAHVVQEKSVPYLAELRMFSDEQLAFGHREYRRALRIFATCYEAWQAGKPPRVAWPGYSVAPEYFVTPSWIAKQIEESKNGTATAPVHSTADLDRELADIDAEFFSGE